MENIKKSITFDLSTSAQTSITADSKDVDIKLFSKVSFKVKDALVGVDFCLKNLPGGIMFFPTIVLDEFASFFGIVADKKQFVYKRASKSKFTQKRIDMDLWLNASDSERQIIAKQFYFDALQQIPDKYINDDERQFVYDLHVKVIDALKFPLKYPLDRDH